MQHILIPTDFSIRSLNAIHTAATSFTSEKLKISLFHLLRPDYDIAQLFRSRRNMHMDMISSEFHDACQIMQNRYSSVINAINIEFGFGTTASYLSNLLEGLKVDVVLVCNDVAYKYDNKSIDPLPLLKKVDVKLQSVSFSYMKTRKNEKAMLGEFSIKDLLIQNTEGDYVITK